MKLFIFLGFFLVTAPQLTFACRIEASGGTLAQNDNLNPTENYFEFSGAATLTAVDCAPSTPGNTLNYDWHMFRPSDGQRIQLSTATSVTIPFGGDIFPHPDARFIWLVVSESGDCQGGCGTPNGYFILKAGRPPQLPVLQASECYIEPQNDIIGYRKFINTTFSGQDPDPPSEPGNRHATYEFPCESANGDDCASGSGKISMTGPQLQKTFVGAVTNATASTELIGLGFSFRRAVELQVTCQNEAPLVAGTISSVISTGNLSTLEFYATDLENDSQVNFNVEVTQAPADAQFTLSNNSGAMVFVQPLRFKGTFNLLTNKSGDYQFKIDLTDSNGNSRTEYRTVNLVTRSFKVLLDGEEYLFEECSPHFDECKSNQNANEFQGGEFLIGDTVNLKTISSSPNIRSTNWRVEKIAVPPNTPDFEPIELSGDMASVTFPSAGKYEITLLSGNANEIPIKKAVKVVDRIEVTFPANGPFIQKPDNRFRPNTKYSSFYFGNVVKNTIEKSGCLMINATNILSRSLRGSVGAEIDPIWANKELVSVNGFTETKTKKGEKSVNDLDYSSLGRVQKKYSLIETLENSSVVLTPQNLEDEIKDLVKSIRKRKYVVLKVESLGSNFSFHFVGATGILGNIFGKDANEVIPKILTSDPASRDFENLSRYGNDIRIVYNFEKDFLVDRKNSFRLATNNQNIKIEYPATTNRQDNFNIYLNRIGDPDASDDSDDTGGWVMDGKDFGNRDLTVNLYSDNSESGLYVLESFDKDGKLVDRKSEEIDFVAGQRVPVTFRTRELLSETTSLNISSASQRSVDSRIPILEITGRIANSALTNFEITEDVYIDIDSTGNNLKFGEIVAYTDRYEFKGPVGAGLSINEFVFYKNGNFKIKTSGLDSTAIDGAVNPRILLKIEKKMYQGSLDFKKLLKPHFVKLNLEGAAFSSSSKINGSLMLARTPTRKHLKYVAELFIDGNLNNVKSLGDGLWSFQTNQLASGKHLLHANVYGIEGKLFQKIQSSVTVEKRKILRLKDALAEETDLDKIAIIEKEIQALEYRINQLETELRSNYVKLGETAFKTILVL